jgi:hypothetical protein
MPVRTTVGVCPYCEEETLQKEAYDELADGAVVVYLTTCTVCNKDL